MPIKSAESKGSWLRRRIIRAPFATPVDLTGQRVIVTGASIGSIGNATAKTLAQWGAHVVITARQAPEESAASLRAELPSTCAGSVTPTALDLSQRESVSRFVQWYHETQGDQLDILINNAGIHLDLLSQWKSPRLSSDGFELHWRVNYLGTLDLSRQLLPFLLASGRKSDNARIVNVVSQLHTRGKNRNLATGATPYNSWTAYALSKLAVVHMSFEMHRRYGDQGLKTYCLHPGAVYSRIADKGLEGAPLLSQIRKWLAPLEQSFMMNIVEGAQTSLYCATAPEAEPGRYYRRCKPAQPSPEAQDPQVSQRLWDGDLAPISK